MFRAWHAAWTRGNVEMEIAIELSNLSIWCPASGYPVSSSPSTSCRYPIKSVLCVPVIFKYFGCFKLYHQWIQMLKLPSETQLLGWCLACHGCSPNFACHYEDPMRYLFSRMYDCTVYIFKSKRTLEKQSACKETPALTTPKISCSNLETESQQFTV